MVEVFDGDIPSAAQIFEEACTAAELGHHDEARRLLAIAGAAIWLSDETQDQ